MTDTTPADEQCHGVYGEPTRTAATHCWHQSHYLTTNPPIAVERCCYCGQERRIRTGWNDGIGHGRFKP